jgi:hypothetical protein
MAIVGGFDIHRRQVTFDYLDTVTGQVRRGRISPACRETLRHWLERFAGRDDVTFAGEGCTGWQFVVEELQRAGITALLAEPAETAHLRGPKRLAKTDKTDSRHLRMLVADGRVPLSWIPPAQVCELRALLQRRAVRERPGPAGERDDLMAAPLGLGQQPQTGAAGGPSITILMTSSPHSLRLRRARPAWRVPAPGRAVFTLPSAGGPPVCSCRGARSARVPAPAGPWPA